MNTRAALTRVLCAFLMLASPAAATPVVADISTYRIAIDANFSGMHVFVFGARNDAGDVVVAIRGPARDFAVRKKERVMGMWVNHGQLTLQRVPGFYAVASTRPLADIATDALRLPLRLGIDQVLATQEMRERARFTEFSQAFLTQQQRKRLYQPDLSLNFMGETLFKSTIPFPDSIPEGDYTAEVYLISGGQLAGMQTMPIRVEKTGLDAFIFNVAHGWPWLYGIAAVCVAAAAGWLAGRLFGKN